MPNTREDTLPDSLGDCVACFCNRVTVTVYLCVHVFDFEGICVIVQWDVKEENDKTPVEVTQRQKVRVRKEEERKCIKIRLLWSYAKAGKCTDFQAGEFWPWKDGARPNCEELDKLHYILYYNCPSLYLGCEGGLIMKL